MGTALHAVVARRALSTANPVLPSEENLIEGARLYAQMCSRCHGLSKESDNSYGQSFYPPAPHLPLRRTSYSEPEVFWIVKHGIRNTAMPAWGNLLSDEDIWRVVTLIDKFGFLPDSVLDNRLGRRLLKEAGRRALGLGPLFDCAVAPSLLPWFNWIEKRSLYEPGGVNGTPTIFDRLAEARVPYRSYSYHRFSDGEILRQAARDVRESNAGVFFLAVYDATMARFWFFSDRARQVITSLLASLPCGRVLDDAELERLGILFPDRRYGEVIALLDPGWLLASSGFNGSRWRPAGMHGYHPDDADSDGVFLASATPLAPVRSLADVHACLSEAAS